MVDADRKASLESFRAGPERVRRAVDGAAGALDYRPFADAWTIRENIVHLCDAEVHCYERCRKAISEPGSRVEMFDEIKWHATLDYGAVEHKTTLGLYEALRLATAALADRLAAADWSAYRIEHPVRGTETLEALLRFFTGHDTFHLDLIERNTKLFKESKGKGGR